MANIYNNPGALMTAILALRDGLANKPPQGLTQLSAGGKVSTLPDLVTELNGYYEVYKAADDAIKARDKALQARGALESTALTRFEEIQASVKAAMGKRNPDLANMGITPDQPRAPLTAEQKVLAAAKARATRAARHTMGAKQKAAIKGQLSPQGAPQGVQPPAPPAPPPPAPQMHASSSG
jgi:hypothetical protein